MTFCSIYPTVDGENRLKPLISCNGNSSRLMHLRDYVALVHIGFHSSLGSFIIPRLPGEVEICQVEVFQSSTRI